MPVRYHNRILVSSLGYTVPLVLRGAIWNLRGEPKSESGKQMCVRACTWRALIAASVNQNYIRRNQVACFRSIFSGQRGEEGFLS